MDEKHEEIAFLTRRIRKVEREARAVKFLGAALAVGLVILEWPSGGGASQASVSSETNNSGHEPQEGRFERVTTKLIEVTDDRDRVRASIHFASEDHSDRQPVILTLYGEQKGTSIELTAGGTGGPELTVFDGGFGRARFGMNGADPIVQLNDRAGKASALLWYMEGTPHLVLQDEHGRSRAVFGYDSAWKEGPARPEKPVPSTIALYDDKGQVLWSATGTMGSLVHPGDHGQTSPVPSHP